MNDVPYHGAPVAVIGAGPVGLAAAAHLVQRGLPFVLFESADDISASFAGVRHVRLFSPWRFNVDRAARALLTDAGVAVPDGDRLPSAAELIDDYSIVWRLRSSRVWLEPVIASFPRNLPLRD